MIKRAKDGNIEFFDTFDIAFKVNLKYDDEINPSSLIDVATQRLGKMLTKTYSEQIAELKKTEEK